MDALDKSSKLASSIETLEKVPGMKSIINIMEKKRERILKEKEDTVSEVLDPVEDSLSSSKSSEE